MQTFAPIGQVHRTIEGTFRPDLEVLDYRRLGKQRIEAKQVAQALMRGRSLELRSDVPQKRGWLNHPAVLMWKHRQTALLHYGRISCEVWIEKGYQDTTLPWFLHELERRGNPKVIQLPDWWGWPEFHASHRSKLLTKDPHFYRQYGWVEPLNLEYIWPGPSE